MEIQLTLDESLLNKAAIAEIGRVPMRTVFQELTRRTAVKSACLPLDQAGVCKWVEGFREQFVDADYKGRSFLVPEASPFRELELLIEVLWLYR